MLNRHLQPPLKLQGKFSHINECKDHELYSLSENPQVKIRLQVISVRGREAAFPGRERKYSRSQWPEREREREREMGLYVCACPFGEGVCEHASVQLQTCGKAQSLQS